MDDFRIDIVLPVWNRPVETRSALVSLMASTAGARFVLVDNGSDRETEHVLHEFAEGLAEGALLVRTERNEGLVPAINRGLSRGSAPYVAVVTPGTIVTDGWSDPLLRLMDEEPDVAAVLPPLSGKNGKGSELTFRETTDLSFAAMVLRRRAVESTGLLAPDLDGDVWCLKEYVCRLHAGGWRTFQSAGPFVEHAPRILYGSHSRRRALTERSRDLVLARWGENCEFCLQSSPAATVELLRGRMPTVLAAARQGHRLTLLLPARLHDGLALGNDLPLHTGITLVRLPRFFPQRGAASALAALRSRVPTLITVNLVDDAAPAGDAPLSFARFADLIAQRQRDCFRR